MKPASQFGANLGTRSEFPVSLLFVLFLPKNFPHYFRNLTREQAHFLVRHGNVFRFVVGFDTNQLRRFCPCPPARVEDADDVAWLKRARTKPLHYRPLEDYLAERNRK